MDSLTLNLIHRPYLISFAKAVFELPLPRKDLKDMAYKIKSNANAIRLYEEFVKENDNTNNGDVTFVKNLSFHELLAYNYYFSKSPRICNINICLLPGLLTRQIINSLKESINKKIITLNELSDSVAVMIPLQQRIIELQTTANKSWNGLVSNDGNGRRKVYHDELQFQKTVHEQMATFSSQFAIFKSLRENIDTYIPGKILSLDPDETISKEADIFNSISRRSTNRDMSKKEYQKYLDQTKALQKEVVSLSQKNLEELTEAVRSLQELISQNNSDLEKANELTEQLSTEPIPTFEEIYDNAVPIEE